MKRLAVVAVAGAAATAATPAASVQADRPQSQPDPVLRDGRYVMMKRTAARYREEAAELQRLLTRRVMQARRFRYHLVHRASSQTALKLAAVTYNVSETLLYRIASCESTGGNGLNPNAKNRSSTAAGLGQFLDSTWASTRFARFSVYDPYASALAMAEEVQHGHLWQWTASKSCWS